MLKKAFLTCLFLNGCSHMPDLPAYVVLNIPKNIKPTVLRTPAQPLTFPLSVEDQEVIQILSAKFDAEENCAGLAAPQIGFGKQVIIFAAPEDPQLKKWRPDFDQTMPKTIWINPTYAPVGDERHTDYEACFSVDDLAGPVARFKTIRYSAYTPEGLRVEGVARGFLARIIQHEVDHIKGQCFVDHVSEKELLPLEEYRKKRQKAMKSQENH